MRARLVLSSRPFHPSSYNSAVSRSATPPIQSTLMKAHRPAGWFTSSILSPLLSQQLPTSDQNQVVLIPQTDLARDGPHSNLVDAAIRGKYWLYKLLCSPPCDMSRRPPVTPPRRPRLASQ